MQSLRSLFTRPTVNTEAQRPAAQPTELTPEQLAEVAGGLPRVSAPPTVATTETDPLPRVS